MSQENNFVGREAELQVFRRMLDSPHKEKRVLYVSGPGGNGKTVLLKTMINEAKNKDNILVVEELIDFHSTDYRHIDGIQNKIVEVIDHFTSIQKNFGDVFLEYKSPKGDTSETFHRCLQKFCLEHSLVLAFDTLERLGQVASDWLFRADIGGLQVPGLICIVAGRRALDDIPNAPFINKLNLFGLNKEEIIRLVKDVPKESTGDDLFPDLLRVTDHNADMDNYEDLANVLLSKTEGRPLRVQMVIQWARSLETGSLNQISSEQFDQELMRQVFGLEGHGGGRLPVMPKSIEDTVYGAVRCMAVVDRRFDARFLKHLILNASDLIPFHGSDIDEGIQDVMRNLELYFFVKALGKNNPKQVLQLHDEMAELIRKYVWPAVDPGGEQRQQLYKKIIMFYDALLQEEI